MLDVLLGTQIACGFLLAGFMLRDWQVRKRTIDDAIAAKESAEQMVRRIAEIDSSRAAKLLEHDDAIHALRMKIDAAQQKRNPMTGVQR